MEPGRGWGSKVGFMYDCYRERNKRIIKIDTGKEKFLSEESKVTP